METRIMETRIKIISISNHHQWDGLILTQEEYNKLIQVLELSKWFYDVKVEVVE